MVEDALSRKSSSTLASMWVSYLQQLQAIQELGVELKIEARGALLASFVVIPSLLEQILESQKVDEKLASEKQKLEEGIFSNFKVRSDGLLEF